MYSVGTRQPDEVREPHVVEFHGVSKDVPSGSSPTNSRQFVDANFVVQDLIDKGEVHLHSRSQWLRQELRSCRLIAGLRPQHPPTSGKGARDGPAESPDQAPIVAWSFKNYTSFDHRTVLSDNVSFGLECQGALRRERYEHARRWIARVGLGTSIKTRTSTPTSSPGGMRQRVAIARHWYLASGGSAITDGRAFRLRCLTR